MRFSFYASHGIARVHNAGRPIRQFLIIDGLMIGGDDDRVKTSAGFLDSN